MKLLRTLVLAPLIIAAAAGDPVALSPLPAAAQAATRLVCSSVDSDYSYCRADTRGGVSLRQQAVERTMRSGPDLGF